MEPQNNTPQQTPMTSVNPEPQPVQISPNLPEKQPEPPKGEGFKSFLSTIAIIIAAPIIAILLTNFVFQSYEVDGPSMQTTLENHDRLLVLKLPKTFAKITNREYVPHRDEIIIFETSAIHDGSGDAGETKQLVKRVVGLPGDRVVVSDGVVTVYNNEFPEGFNPDKLSYHGEYVDSTSGNVDVVVRDGEVFVMGDHRANSLDSRAIGTIPTDDVIGKLIFRLYPLNTAQKF